MNPDHERLDPARRRTTIALGAVVAGGLVVALVLAFFVSPWASSQPDGLERVAIDQGFAQAETGHGLSEGPLAGYETEGVANERLTTGVAGVIGVAVTFLVGFAVFLGMRALRARGSTPVDTVVPAAQPAGGRSGP